MAALTGRPPRHITGRHGRRQPRGWSLLRHKDPKFMRELKQFLAELHGQTHHSGHPETARWRALHPGRRG